jgi:hypothetical protein
MTQTTALSAAKDTLTRFWSSPPRLLIAAAIFHLVMTVSVFELGRHGVVPGTVDINGIAVSFASDGPDLREEAARLGESLAHGQIRDWFRAVSPFHIKLYSVCFALLEPLFGPTILSAEPLNVSCYLAILILTFKLSEETFDRRIGLIAATTVALWPSFLLHTTQLLKDPLFLVGMLAFVLVNLRLLSRNFPWPRALLTGLGGGLLAIFIWLARDSMGELPIATAVVGAGLIIVRQFREKEFCAPTLVGMTMLIVLSVGVTQVVPKFRKPHPSRNIVETADQDIVSRNSSGAAETAANGPLARSPLSRLAARVGKVRRRFVTEHPDAGSNIDSDVRLASIADIIRYLPRAAAIGFFAPFPKMWLATGNQVGSAGRLLSGLETMAMYVIEGLAVVGVWSGIGRRRFSVWFLGLVAAMGMITLGLVVVNVGTLYRLRYVFLILIIILASGGAANTLEWFRKRRA